MSAFIPAAIFGLAAGLFRASFFPALPSPFSAIDPVLILIVWEVSALRPRHAFVVALAAGLVTDALSSLPPGSHVLAYAVGAAVATALFTRVFTNHGWPALLGISAAAFAATHAMLALARLLHAIFTGLPAATALGETTFLGGLAAVGVHLAATLAAFAFIALMKRVFSRFFYTR